MPEPYDFPRLDALLEAALDLPAAGRARWIAEVCGEDAALRDRLQRLVALAEGGEDVFPPSGGLSGVIWEDLARELSAVEPVPQAGMRLGRYELRGVLGVGGMSRVYKAFDPVLAREVAIKALSEALENAPELRRRLEREARLLATVSHPNVATIHGLELIDGAPYLVLELVEGPTLAERLERGALPLEQAVGAALQVATALEEAHRKGVVHRDLKPANVKLSPQGHVKVLDFGIAKPVTRAHDAQASDRASSMTRAGAVLGTAPYMSPEQVRGEAVDTRTDVWAFGCLLYEMLAGQPAFRGASPAEVMAAVLRDDVDWNRLPPETPAPLRRLLRRCLRREVRERLQDIGDARLELSELGREEPQQADAGASRAGVRTLWPWLAAMAISAALLGVWVGRTSEQAPTRGVTRLSLELPAGLDLADDYAPPFAVSPDGSRLAVLATEAGISRLYLREVSGLEAVPIAGTEGAWQPFFSPDGRELAFFAERKLKRVSLDDGTVRTIADIDGNPRGASWGSDGTIVLSPGQFSPLYRVEASGGALKPMTHLDFARGEGSHRWPQILPGGRWALATANMDEASFDEAWIEVVALETGERRRVLDGGAYGRYAAGRLFFVHGSRCLAVPFDLHDMAVHGTPEVVLDGVRFDARNGATHLALSDAGTLVYRPAAPTSTDLYAAWVDADGSLMRIGNTPRRFREVSLSPDARRVAARIGSEAESDLWILDTASAALSRLSFGLSPHRPLWTPDGAGITVAAEHAGRWQLLTLSASGSSATTTVLEGPNRMYPNAWSPDGRFLVFQERRPDTGWNVRVVDIGRDGRSSGAPRDLAATPAQERNATVSLDGRLVAYESDELDVVIDIYVARLADPAQRIRATTTYARWPRWGPGGQLYYWYPIRARPRVRPLESRVEPGLHQIDWRAATARPGLSLAASLWGEGPRAKALLARLVVAPYASYDVDVSGPRARFLFLETSTPANDASFERPVVVLNWFEDLRSRAGGRQ